MATPVTLEALESLMATQRAVRRFTAPGDVVPELHEVS